MAYLGSAEQEVGTIERRNRNNLLQRAVSSPRMIGRAAARPRLGRRRRSTPRRTAPSPSGLCDPRSMHRSTQTCSITKAMCGHPSRAAAVRIIETPFPPTQPVRTGGTPQKRSSASTLCRQRKPRPGRPGPHAKPTKAPRTATERILHDSQQPRRAQRMQSRSRCARSTTG